MINGVLVERTVQDIIPALKTNAEGLKKVLEDLVKQYKLKQDELEKWKVSLVDIVHLGILITHYPIEKEQCASCTVSIAPISTETGGWQWVSTSLVY